MKKMTIQTLAVGNLRLRKKQYARMTAGIVLAMVFSSGMLFFLSCLQSSLTALSHRGYGAQDGIVTSADTTEPLQELLALGIVRRYGLAEVLGCACAEEGSARRFSVARYDADALALACHSAVQGRLPARAGEIAVEADTLLQQHIGAGLGNAVTLQFWIQDGDGYLPQPIEKTYVLVGVLENKCSNIYHFDDRSDRTDLPAALVSSEEQIEPGGRARTVVYFSLTESHLGRGDRFAAFENYNDAHPWFRSDRMIFNWSGSYVNLSGNEAITNKGALAGLLAAVLAVASCVGIVQAFNANLQERRHQIGLLRAVGATRRQIVQIFGREALLIALLSAPLSVALSYGITSAVIRLMGEDMVFAPQLWILPAGAAVGVLLVMAAALIPLLFAARISPMQAIRGVELNRKFRARHLKSRREFRPERLLAQRALAFRRGRTAAMSLLLALSFALSTAGFSFLKTAAQTQPLLPYDYTVRRGSYSVTSEWVNFATADGTYGLSSAAIGELYLNPYIKAVSPQQSFYVTAEPEKTYEIIDTFKSIAHVEVQGKNSLPSLTLETYRDWSREHEVPEAAGSRAENARLRNALGCGERAFNTRLLAADEDLLQTLQSRVIDGEIRLDRINAGEEILLCLPEKASVIMDADSLDLDGGWRTFITFDVSDRDIRASRQSNRTETLIGTVRNDVRAGDEITLTLNFEPYRTETQAFTESAQYPGLMQLQLSDQLRQIRKTVKIGAIVAAQGEFGNDYLHFCDFAMTNAGLAALGAPEGYTALGVELAADCTPEIDAAVTRDLESMTAGTVFQYQSEFSYREDQKQTVTAVAIGLLSLLILFFAVSASMIVNAMNADLREGKRQFGTLRAVGADARILSRICLLRLLRVFAIGLAGGLGAVLLANLGLWIYRTITGEATDFWLLTLWPALLLLLLIFGICAGGPALQIRRMNRSSIVESIREL